MADEIYNLICVVGGETFRSLDPSETLCPKHGGPPEPAARSDSQLGVTEVPQMVCCVVCGVEFMPPSPEVVLCPEHGGYQLDTSGWQSGSTILNTYRVVGLLGEGGMGRVYRVQHLGWKTDLAAKRPRAEMFASDAGRQKFADEAETWVKLGLHPYIVTCYYVRNIDDLPVIFSEMMTGGSLQRWIEDRRLYQGDSIQALGRMLDIAIQFCWGLQHAHNQGLVHCDVKPANVLMTPEGIAKVADFGLAKARKVLGEEEDADLTGSKVWFTPRYGSPEQAEGKELDLRTDLWSWAVSILEMFTGEAYWYSGTVAAAALNQYLDGAYETRGIPRMPGEVADLLRQCLQENPRYRLKDMSEAVRILQQAYSKITSQKYPRSDPMLSAEQHADSLNNKAISLLDLGREREAEQAWQEALKGDRLHADVIYNQAVYLWARGKKNPIDPDSQAPTNILESMARQFPHEWRRWYYLAMAHMAMRDAPTAINHLKQALETVGKTARHDQEAQAAATEMEAEIKALEACQSSWPHVATRFKGVDTLIFSLAPALGGGYLVSGSGKTDNKLRLWKLENGEQSWALQGPRDRVRALAVDPQGKTCLAASVDHNIYVCDLENGALRYTLSGHTGAVNAVAHSPLSEQAISGSSDCQLFLWDLNERQGKLFGTHEKGIYSVTYTPSGEQVISAGDDRKIYVWSLVDGEKVLEIQSPQVEIWSLDVSADGQSCLSAGRGSPICVWDLNTGELLHSFGRGDRALFLPGKDFAVSYTSDRFFIYDLKKGVLISSIDLPSSDGSPEIKSIALLPDGKGVALAGKRALYYIHLGEIGPPQPRYMISRIALVREGTEPSEFGDLIDVIKWRLEAGNWTKAIEPIKRASQLRGYERSPELLELRAELGKHGIRTALESRWFDKTFEGAPGEDTCVAIAPDGKWAVSGGEDRIVRLLDITTGNCCEELGAHTKRVRAVAVSDNGRVIASVSKDGLQHWRYAKGEWVAGGKTLGASQFEVDLSLDGRYALTADRDGDNILWDLETGESLLTLEGGELISLCPDGRHAAFASGKRVMLVDLRDKETKTYQAEQPLKGILLTADRRHLLAFDETSKLYSWEIKTGDLFTAREQGLVYDMAITPGAHYAVVSSSEGVKLWDMRTWDRMDVLENPRRMLFRTLAVSMNGRYVLAAGEQLSLWELVWEYKFPEPTNWDIKAQAYLDNFHALHTQYGKKDGKPEFDRADVEDFLSDLGYRGLGWLDSAAIRSRLEEEE